MSKEKKELECKMVGSVSEVNTQLKLLLEAFSEGSIVIADGEDVVRLSPAGSVLSK
jgi:hypothetical protein